MREASREAGFAATHPSGDPVSRYSQKTSSVREHTKAHIGDEGTPEMLIGLEQSLKGK